jgi:hypothetical protein
MAIKPTDIIIYLDDERYMADTFDWDGRPSKESTLPVYWENFRKHALMKVNSITNIAPYQRHVALQQEAIRSELAKHNIEYKESKRGPYLKFKHEADITFFKLKWT